jgi:hypothetical protein
MPLLSSELVWKASALTSDTVPAQNGGVMGTRSIVSGVKNAMLPDVSQSQRTLGVTHIRKAFLHIVNTLDLALLNAKLFLSAPTPGADYVVFYPGTQSDTQSTMSSRPYGVGTLQAATVIGATTIKVICDNNTDYATLTPFRVGDVVRVSDRPIGGSSGSEEFVTVSTVTYGASYATLTFTPALASAYSDLVNTVISSVYKPATVEPTFSGVAVTSVSGTFNSAISGNVTPKSKGGIKQTWTLTFTSPTNFTLSGDLIGLVGNGTINADYNPTNSATASPYFTLKSTAWGGTFLANDTMVFSTEPASCPIYFSRIVPPGTASVANDSISIAVQGESA